MRTVTPYKLWSLNFTVGINVDDPCPICQHKWGPHELACPNNSPFDGGTFTCPVKDCLCSGNWEPATLRS